MKLILPHKNDFSSSLVVFLVALPLCLGIAFATGLPAITGVISGIAGGLIVGLLSGSQLSVSGPAAGLIVVVTTAISSLNNDLNLFFTSVFLAGILQIIFGVLRVGFFGEFVPTSVIKGMMAAIGFILIFKQIPHLVGYDGDYEGDENFIQADGNNTITELFHASVHSEAVVIGLTCMLLLIFFDSKRMKNTLLLKIAPPFLIVVLVGIILNVTSKYLGITEQLEAEHFIQLPSLDTASSLFIWNKLNLENFFNSTVWVQATIIAIVASLETLLNIEATDKFDDQKRITPPNRELLAQGIGNAASGLFGGLPVTSVVVRSSSNRLAGGKTKWSAFMHGIWLLMAVLFLGPYLNMVPLSALAAILIMVGYKLTKPAIFKDIWKEGIAQFLPFIATFLAIYFSDMLKGVIVGLAFGLFFVIRSNFKSAIRVTKGDNNDSLLRFRKEVSFLNKPALKKALLKIPEGSFLLIDARKCEFMDPDILEILQDFIVSAKVKNIRIELNKNNWGELPEVLKNIKL
jgi:MFS superfamily sulfate permease-like transporter